MTQMTEVVLHVPQSAVEVLPKGMTLREAQLAESYELLLERIASLEFAMEDEGWQLLSAEGQREFSRRGLRTIINRARLMYLSNPLIRRGVDVKANYVFGQGVEFEAVDPAVNEVLQAFLTDPKNVAEFASHQAMTMKEVDLAVEGNIFLVYFTEPASGKVRVRTLPVDEVEEIVCNPEDAKEPWFYRRVWLQGTKQEEALYPDVNFNPRRKNPTWGGKEIRWDQPVGHVKVGSLSAMKFGVPETYPAHDWAKAYKEALEDRATFARALSRFAQKLTMQGSAASLASAKDMLNTTLGPGQERNPPPNVGSTFIGRKDRQGNAIADIEPVKLGGASLPVDNERPFRLQVAAALGLPETFFGDADVGNYATSKTLDRPTELMMTQRRNVWGDVYQGMFAYVIRKAVQAPGGPLRARFRLMGNGDTEPYRVAGKAKEKGQLVEPTVNITWPPLLEHDAAAMVEAIEKAAPFIGEQTTVRLFLSALDVKDIDEKIALWFGEEPDKIPETALVTPAPIANEDAMVEAVRELREAVRRMAA